MARSFGPILGIALVLTLVQPVSTIGGSFERGSRGTEAGDMLAVAVATGLIHSCALTSSGSVKCWGDNYRGQLGEGTSGDVRGRATPGEVLGLGGGVASIASGQRHTCALMTGGTIRCWGANRYGELGDGTTVQRTTPVNVAGLAGAVRAIAAAWHTCAITTAGEVECWGLNDFGQLGDGTTTDRSTPAAVSGLRSGVKAIAAGNAHTCALTDAGAVECWGDNEYGQLGDGTTATRHLPVTVSGLAGGALAVAVGSEHSCALMRSGGVKCWGLNAGGQLGDGTRVNRRRPVAVVGLRYGVIAIAADRGRGVIGEGHTCALTHAGAVKCWGENADGQLGDRSTRERTRPVNVSGLSGGVIAIDAGGRHTCAVTRTGGVKCWGYDAYGQIGDGATGTVLHTHPTEVIGFGTAKVTLAILSRSIRASRAGVASIRLRCSAAGPCTGVLQMTATVRGRRVGSARPWIKLRLGDQSLSIAAGRQASVDVKLTGSGLKLLKRAGRLVAKVEVSYKQPAGDTTTTSRTVLLTLPRPKGAQNIRSL